MTRTASAKSMRELLAQVSGEMRSRAGGALPARHLYCIGNEGITDALVPRDTEQRSSASLAMMT
jgi:hypothetical protein